MGDTCSSPAAPPEAGLLEREKRGVWAYYRLVPTAIATIADLLTPPRKRATKKAR